MAEEKLIGSISHSFAKIGVGIIELKDLLEVGDTIHVKGHSSDFTLQVSSMQIEHADVKEAKAGDSVGVKLGQKVHEHDAVYKVIS